MPTENLYRNAEPPATGERFETLLAHRNLVIERIVSAAGVAPVEFNQPQDEWVLLAHGSATLEVDGVAQSLGPGDHVFLPAGTPHRVLQASHGAIWLAVHLHPVGDEAPDSQGAASA